MVRLQNYTKEGLLRLDEAQQKNQETAEQVSQIEQAILEHMDEIKQLLKQSDDFTHKENVKVYRNVQAVVIDENDKQNENSGKSFGYLSVRTNAILVVSLVSLLASCAGLVFQILVYLHIL